MVFLNSSPLKVFNFLKFFILFDEVKSFIRLVAITTLVSLKNSALSISIKEYSRNK